MDCVQDLEGWKLTDAQQRVANKRSNDLGGEANWLPQDMNFLTKNFKLKAVDFVRLSKGAMSYVFQEAFNEPRKANQKQAFASFNETLRLQLTTHCNADGRPLGRRLKEKIARLHEQVSETLSLLEMCSPLILFDRVLHELLHIPAALAKWNSCRNFWAFKSERYVNNVG
jgi:hypothetical protein